MLTNARVVYQPHDHVRILNAAISRAHEICEEANVRLTPTREAILKLLWQSHKPMGAYQLQQQLGNYLKNPLHHPQFTVLLNFC